MSKFSPLAMIKQQQEENKYRTQVLDLREVQEHPNNDFPITNTDIENLADSILKSGGVLQFPLVRLLDDGSYQMLAGHRRRRASLLLGERVDEKYFRTMCYVLEGISDEKAELYLIDTNIQARELSPKLRAQKISDSRRLIQLLKDRGELDIKSVRKAVAEQAGVSESTVILQTRIADQLNIGLLDLYDQGKITTREAYDYSGLSEQSQEEILEIYSKGLDKDHLQKEITRTIIQDKMGVNHPSKPVNLEKEASRKLSQARRRLEDVVAFKHDGVLLDRETLNSLRSLLDELLSEEF